MVRCEERDWTGQLMDERLSLCLRPFHIVKKLWLQNEEPEARVLEVRVAYPLSTVPQSPYHAKSLSATKTTSVAEGTTAAATATVTELGSLVALGVCVDLHASMVGTV